MVLNASIQKQVRELFAQLPSPVTLAVFTRRDEDDECESCDEVRDLAAELAALSDGKVTVETFDLERDHGYAQIYDVDKAPAIVVLGDASGHRDFGIRYYGVPAGYEFGTLVEDIRLASAGRADLQPATLDALSHLTAPLHIQVFVTPTCPYCPRAVLLAHKLAMASEFVTADGVDATEFPELAEINGVQGVPRTVVNNIVHVEGAVPESMLMAEIIPLLQPVAAAT